MLLIQTPEPMLQDSYGRSICVVADVNDDAVLDFAVADGRWGTGTVVVDLCSGKTQHRLWRATVRSDDVDCITLIAAGDRTGDGKAELILSCWNVDVVHILSGADASVVRSLQGKARLEKSSHFGSELCTADFDGDTTPDIAIGEQIRSTTVNEGLIHLFSGNDGAIQNSISVGDMWIHGLETGFDFDGDGGADLAALVGDSGNERIPETRTVRIFAGKSGSLWGTFQWAHSSAMRSPLTITATLPRLITFERGWKDERVCNWVARFLPDAEGNAMQLMPFDDCVFSQAAICIATDLNGDGVEDIVRGDHEAGFYQGEVVAFSGKDGSRLWKLAGAYDLGAALASGIDFDGDEVSDVLAGAVQLSGYEHDGSVWGISGRTGKHLWTLTRDSP